jgi:hypothetical protein
MLQGGQLALRCCQVSFCTPGAILQCSQLDKLLLLLLVLLPWLLLLLAL